ncbi:MAG: cell division protein ZipA C-terminal FtsZ-binding domain-containing protein [Methylococcales bacterium]|nr:cell division protein ZipA C-terminal FtsZ-binding domain-containing protein [Methylococcales bacterium]
MDKDTLRIVIFLIGLLVVAGMIAWSFFQHQKDQREFEEYDQTSPPKDSYSFSAISSALKKTTEKFTEPLKEKVEPVSSENNEPSATPNLIQLSIISPNEEGFKGEDIFEVLNGVGLAYGTLQIFERLDSNRLVDFAVANVVNPGIFPQDDLTNFSCPGLSFFMQPKKVDHPIEVFEDFVRTFNFVALKLGGEMIDSQHQVLTDETLQQIRQCL